MSGRTSPLREICSSWSTYHSISFICNPRQYLNPLITFINTYFLLYLLLGSANVSVTKASVIGENGGANGSTGGGAGENGSVSDDEEDEDGEDFWHTSVGKFKFTLDQLPQPLQYIHQLLTVSGKKIF